MPLLPCVVTLSMADRFVESFGLTLLALFGIGTSRALISRARWWSAGAEMLGIGAIVAVVACGSGALVAGLEDGPVG